MSLISKLFRRKPETFVPVKSWNFGVDDWKPVNESMKKTLVTFKKLFKEKLK